MSTCPNPNTPEWKALVSALGEGDATTAYFLNGNATPTEEQARALLSKLKVEEKDESYSRSSDAFKLERAKAQMTMLTQMSARANASQKETIQKLIDMNLKQQEFLKKNIELAKQGQPTVQTVSVSTFIGSSDFSGDPKEYEAFKLFGTFMHELLELSQMESLKTGVTLQKILTPEFYNNALDNYKKKNPFFIENLSDDAMYEMAMSLASEVGTYNNKGYMILPEITVTGTTSTGAVVVGRLDLLLIDPEGIASIFDFKTKKVKDLVVTNNLTGQDEIDKDRAFIDLANTPYAIDTDKEGTARAFRGGSRTAYDTWTLQLKVYENMLLQNDIEVEKKQIMALLYQTDQNKAFKGSAVHVFEKENFYIYAATASIPGNNGVWKSEPTMMADKLKGLRKIVDQELPISEEQAKVFEKRAEILDFKLTKKDDTKLKNLLIRAVKTELEEISKQVADLKKQDNPDQLLLDILSERRKTLVKYEQDIINRITTDKDLSLAYNFSLALDAVETDALKLSDVVDKAMETYKMDKNSSTSSEARAVKEAYKKASSLGVVFKTLEDIVTEASKTNPENLRIVEQEIKQRFIKIYGAINNVEAAFRQVVMVDSIDVLKTLGEKTFVTVNAEMKEGLEPELRRLEKRLEDLKAGRPASFIQNVKHRALLFMDSGYKKRVSEAYGEENAAAMVEMEHVQREILRVKALMEGSINFTDESLQRFLEGITDPNTDSYAGSQNSYVSNPILAGVFLDQGIASASNSDIAISAYTLMLKDAPAQAALNMQNRIATMKFEQKRDKLLQKYTVEELNDLMSEYRTFTYLNQNGEAVTERRLTMNKPYSQEYEDAFNNYNIKSKQLRKELSTLRADRNEKFGTPEYAAAEAAFTAKSAELDKLRDDHYEWLLTHARPPYIDKFYSLQKEMPQEIRDAMQKIYIEMEQIQHIKGRGNEVLLDPEDFERLEELEIELKKLREKAVEINPVYKTYLDDMNDLYEFDVNYNYYDRMRSNARAKYEETDPATWEKWKRRNEIQRPTKRPELPDLLERDMPVFYKDEIYTVVEERPEGAVELISREGELIVAMRKDLESLSWYERIGILYDLRGELVSSDPEIKALYEERAAILRKYKIGGRLQPKFMSEDDVRALDEIYGKIEIYMELNKSNPKLPLEIRKQLGAISAEIRNLTEEKLAQGYIDTFDDKLNVLEGAQREIVTIMNELAKAKTQGETAIVKQLEIDLNKAESNFGKEEEKFKQWYNLHHNNEYKSIMKGYDVRRNALPKRYNFERLPSAAVAHLYMETVPHPRYKIKRIKESAKNPDYLESPDGIPMPKAISQDENGHYYITPGYENSSSVSSKYKSLMENTELFSFYNDVMDMYFELQKKVEGKKMGYMVPGFAASTVENIARKGMFGSFKAEYEKFKDKTWRNQSLSDAVDGRYGDLNGLLRHRFTRQLPEDMQTRDAIGAIMKYSLEAEMNIALQEVAPKADSFIMYLEYTLKNLQQEVASGNKFTRTNAEGVDMPVDMKKRISELENMLSILRFERNKHLYGQYESGAALNRSISKKLNMLFAYTSFVRIGFDVVNQTKNYISGNVQAFIAAGALESDKYTRDDYFWAKNKVYGYNGFLHQYFADFGKIGEASESTMLYRYFNPAQKDFMGYMNELTGSNKRKVANNLTNIQEWGYMLQDKGDTEIAITVMYAVMNHNRFNVIERFDENNNPVYKKDAEGNIVTVPVHEIYYKANDGSLQRRKDVEFDQDDERRIRNIIYSEMRRTQGNYARIDQTAFEGTVVGKLVYFYRKYMVPQMLNRFGYLRPNYEGAEAAIGYWRAVAIAFREYGPQQVLKHWIAGSKAMSNSNDNKLGPLFTRKVAQAKRDAIFMAVLSVMSMMALMYVRKKDEDDEELSFLEGNAIRILWGVQGETTSMFPIGGGSEEYIRNFTTFTTSVRELTTLKKFAAHAFYYTEAMLMNSGVEPTDEDSEFYQDVWKNAFYSRKSGMYEKGDPKIQKDIMDLTGIKNFRDLLDPNYRIDQMKRNQ